MSVRAPRRIRNLGVASCSVFVAAIVAFAAYGCTSVAPDELDKQLAKAKKEANKRKPAECYPGLAEPCYALEDGVAGPAGTAGRGICQEGERQCDAEGFWSPCVGAVLPATETCNNIDDNCNGKVDDGFERAGTKCVVGQGECRAEGTYSCSADGTASVCSATAKDPSPEICDGKDNDCNGKIDDGDIAGTGDQCNTGQPGACSVGTKQCIAGGIKCMATHVRSVEICNGIDDNCNGKVDDDCITEQEARAAGIIK